jgi:hypothetical protein
MVVNVSRRMGTLLPSLASSSPSRFATMTATPIRAVAPPSAVLAPQGWATPVRPVVSSAPVALAPLTAAQSPSYGNALPGMPGYGDVPIVANSQPAATPAAGFYKYKQPTPASSAPISTDWSQTNVSPFANPLANGDAGAVVRCVVVEQHELGAGRRPAVGAGVGGARRERIAVDDARSGESVRRSVAGGDRGWRGCRAPPGVRDLRGGAVMPDRTKGQTLALMIVGGVVSSLCSAVVFGLLAKAKEADARQPLPGPIVPGHGTV